MIRGPGSVRDHAQPRPVGGRSRTASPPISRYGSMPTAMPSSPTYGRLGRSPHQPDRRPRMVSSVRRARGVGWSTPSTCTGCPLAISRSRGRGLR